MNLQPLFMAAADFTTETWGDRFALCGRMVLAGMGTVFLVLIILWGVIAVFGAVARLREKKERQRIMEEVRNSPAPNDIHKTLPADVPEDNGEAAGEDPGVLAAVITAAIEAFTASEGLPAGAYRVVSFRRKNTKKSWNGHADD